MGNYANRLRSAFGFPIVGLRSKESHPKYLVPCLIPSIEKRPPQTASGPADLNLHFAFLIFNFALSNDPVGSDQDIRRHRQTDLLGRFQIDDELELHRLLDG